MSYKAQPYDPARHMGVDYHPRYEYRYKREMRERFPDNLVPPLPLQDRGPMPITVPDIELRDHKMLCECDPCKADYVLELKRRRRRNLAAQTLRGASSASLGTS